MFAASRLTRPARPRYDPGYTPFREAAIPRATDSQPIMATLELPILGLRLSLALGLMSRVGTLG